PAILTAIPHQSQSPRAPACLILGDSGRMEIFPDSSSGPTLLHRQSSTRFSHGLLKAEISVFVGFLVVLTYSGGSGEVIAVKYSGFLFAVTQICCTFA
ncbi:hypothetical protein, partial [Duncaniella muris]|uniref:hypothetical protein n=1 Tax=Duncaniella muris TaxID=2094150 RepID=UPI0025A5F92C